MSTCMETPRPEYPRPQLVRESWANLNGLWEFEEDSGLSGEARGLTSGRALSGAITVPFCPESKLSGVGKTDFMRCVWYRKLVTVPQEWSGERVILHFGAVDYEATVWVNGTKVGGHRGGYTSFALEVTEQLRFGHENEIVLRAYDDTRSGLQPSGKQSDRYESYGCSYTRTTGIWQTVWLECVPQTYIKGLRIDPNLDNASVNIIASIDGSLSGLRLVACAQAGGATVGESSCLAASTCQVTLPISEVHPWAPGSPFLYDLKLRLVRGDEVVDSVDSYFGLRKVGMEGDAFCLNNKPLFMRMVLDQGFYPDGIYTAPTDEALKNDIIYSMQLGFNGARLHQKVFEPRYLYWADKLGYMVWGEYPNWGLDHADPQALERVLPEWLESLERDHNHPALVGWCPFNETSRHQNDWLLRAVFRATKAADPLRPVIDTSGWIHIGETDIYDVHNYEQDPAKLAEAFRGLAEDGKAFVNFGDRDAPYRGGPYWVSEYGGIWWNPSQEDGKSWGYGDRPKSAEEFVERYRGLTTVLLNHPRMCGFCYTQITDVEQEVNGLMTYDRRFKMDPAIFYAINSQKAAIERE